MLQLLLCLSQHCSCRECGDGLLQGNFNAMVPTEGQHKIISVIASHVTGERIT